MEHRHERPAASQPNRCLAGRIAAADHCDARRTAVLRLWRPGRIEDADPLVVGEPIDGEPAVLRSGCEQHGACGYLVALFELQEVVPVAELE